MPAIRRPAETAILQDNFTAMINERAFGVRYAVGTAFGCECGWEGVGQSRHHLGCNYIFLDGHAKLIMLVEAAMGRVVDEVVFGDDAR